jgi:hypothetical protein
MDDPISGLTTERLLEGLVFGVSNLLMASVGYGELAKENWTRHTWRFRMSQMHWRQPKEREPK